VVNALKGLDPYNNPLQYPGPSSRLTPTGRISTAKSHYAKGGQGDTGLAISQLLASILGPVGPAHRILVDRGGTPYNTEKLWDLNPKQKSGGVPLDLAGILRGLRRVYDPFRATQIVQHPRKHSTSSGSGSSTFEGGSSSGGTYEGAAHVAPVRAALTPPKYTAERTIRNIETALAELLQQFSSRRYPSSSIITGPGGGLYYRQPSGPDRVAPQPGMGERGQYAYRIPVPLARPTNRRARQRAHGLQSNPIPAPRRART